MIETIGQMEQLESIAPEWNELASRHESPLLQFGWFRAGADAFGGRQTPSVYIAKTNGTIDAIAGLSSVTIAGFRKIEMMGASVLREPTGFLYRNEESLGGLLEHILTSGCPVVLHRIASDSPENRLLRSLCARHRILRITRRSATPWIPITTDWNTYERSISSSRRSSLRRSRRRADELGKVTFDFRSPRFEEVDAMLEEVFAVEAAGWKGREGTAMKSRSALREFFLFYTRTATNNNLARICSMRLNGKAIAVLLGVEFADRFWVLKIGFDEQWASCSPGILLMHEVIRWAFEHRLRAFEFLGSDEPWLHMWTDHVHEYDTQWMYPMTPSGLFWLSIDMPNTLKAKLISIKARIRKRWHGKLFPILRHAS